ncbi:MAG: carboxymuconolactone decarboxylase family protein [Azospirillaceae bacterium]|nr:carboxymuconolactone decarboxylase family protein [Azospirillaceae bacterium]
MTTLALLRDRLPDYAKDIKLNLSSLLNDQTLSPQQLWGTLVATALASRQTELSAAILAEAAGQLTPAALEAAKAAASIMAMNNIYYRFTHLAGNPEYATMPARLRMNVIGKPGVEKADFELWSLAVSAVNGCGRCIEAHDAVLKHAGVPIEVILQAVRVAAVVHAVAATLDGEAAIAQAAG